MINKEQLTEVQHIIADTEQRLSNLFGCPAAICIELNQMVSATLSKAVDAVVWVTGITEAQMRSESRVDSIVFARYYCFKLLKKYLKTTFKGIGVHFNRDHSTVIAGLKAFDDLYITNKQVRDAFKKCEEAFLERIVL